MKEFTPNYNTNPEIEPTDSPVSYNPEEGDQYPIIVGNGGGFFGEIPPIILETRTAEQNEEEEKRKAIKEGRETMEEAFRLGYRG